VARTGPDIFILDNRGTMCTGVVHGALHKDYGWPEAEQEISVPDSGDTICKGMYGRVYKGLGISVSGFGNICSGLQKHKENM
jgi:hypothetical protein